MAKFQNNKGVEFELVVTVKTLQACKQELSFDLAKLLYPGSEELAKVSADPIIMCDLCYFVAQHRIPKEQRVSFEDFLDGLSGDALDEAMSAMLEAIADFYPRPEQRAFLRDLKLKAARITARVFAEAQTKLDEISETDLPTTKTTTSEKSPAASSMDSTPEAASSPTNPSDASSSASSSPESPASANSAT